MIRGGVYKVDLGQGRPGHEQRGHRYGLVLSPSSMSWSMATIIPTSTRAQDAVFRPVLELMGEQTRFLVDQIRSVDVHYIGEQVAYLDRDEMAEVEHAMLRYLGMTL